MRKAAEKSIQMLLASMFDPSNRGLTLSFLFGPIGSPRRDRRLSASIHLDELGLLESVLFLRHNGPLYLRNMRPSDIRSMLTDFICEHYAILAPETFLQNFDGSYESQVSRSTAAQLVEAILDSAIFSPTDLLTIYPIDVLEVKHAFDSDQFFIVDSSELTSVKLPRDFDINLLDPSHYPPIRNSEYAQAPSKSLLGVRSPTPETASRLKNIILGAIALLPSYKHRYMFSGRKLTRGWCAFDSRGSTFSSSSAVTPPLMCNLDICHDDHAWLELLSSHFQSESKSTQRKLKALEYFYRSWSLPESERYAALYMSLEGLFGDVARATQAVIDEVRRNLGNHISDRRLRMLADLRAALIHGGAPEIYDSKKYLKYYRKYSADPVADLGLIAAECLRKIVFTGLMKEKPDPNAEVIEKAIRSGRIPKPKSKSILTGELV